MQDNCWTEMKQGRTKHQTVKWIKKQVSDTHTQKVKIRSAWSDGGGAASGDDVVYPDPSRQNIPSHQDPPTQHFPMPIARFLANLLLSKCSSLCVVLFTGSQSPPCRQRHALNSSPPKSTRKPTSACSLLVSCPKCLSACPTLPNALSHTQQRDRSISTLL